MKLLKIFNTTGQLISHKQYPVPSDINFSNYLHEITESGLRLKDLDLELSITTINNENNFNIKRILYVEDDLMLANIARKYCEKAGHFFHAVPSSEEALKLIHKNPQLFNYVFLDKHLPGEDGDVFGKKLKSYNPEATLYIVTGDPLSLPTNILQQGFERVIEKPFTSEQIINILGWATPYHGKKVA